jgi:hypothetical protein
MYKIIYSSQAQKDAKKAGKSGNIKITSKNSLTYYKMTLIKVQKKKKNY